MPNRYRDDSPTAFGLARRQVLLGGLSLVGGLAVVPTLPAIAAAGAWSQESAARFMEISSLLIPHHLHEEVGKRIGAAMSALNPSLSEQVAGLLAIARNKNAAIVEEFFPDVPEGPLKETALAIISAWYLGVVKDADDAEVFAFEYALMYQPTRDVMTIPSYAISGPNAWPAEAPPLENMPDF
ncbi:sugar dehydrogenase complex small subunit [Bradyrhizobium sp.]|uniref:sugar dehydrogenase complex small subunit n=1 Tax=Bradyrhizobium sp. TaxID=376 RepID=UPI003C16D1C7